MMFYVNPTDLPVICNITQGKHTRQEFKSEAAIKY